MPTTAKFRGAGVGGAHKVYGTGKNGSKLSGTVSAGEYTYVSATAVSNLNLIRCRSLLRITSAINLNFMGGGGGSAGISNDCFSGSDNGGSGGLGSGTGGGAGGVGDLGGGDGGSGGTNALNHTAGGGGGGGAGAGCGQGAEGQGGNGAGGGGGGGYAAFYALKVQLANFSAAAAGGGNGQGSSGTIVRHGGGGGGGGAGGALHIVARTSIPGTITVTGGAAGNGGPGDDGGQSGSGGTAGGSGRFSGKALRGSIPTIATTENPIKISNSCGVGIFRPKFGAAYLGSLN